MKTEKLTQLKKVLAETLKIEPTSFTIEQVQKQNRFSRRKEFYKISTQEGDFYHVTQAEDLQKTYHNSLKFHEAAPSLSCKPVACVRKDGLDIFIQEFNSGSHLDHLLENDEISKEELSDILTRLSSLLKDMEEPSTQEAAQMEFRQFSKKLLGCDALSSVDKLLLKDHFLPELEDMLISQSSTKRWTNGDFIGQNIMVANVGNLIIIDCEFATCSHFFQEDWIRLKMFSNSKITESPAFVSEYRSIPPVYEAYFWLHQVFLADTAFTKSKARLYVPRYLQHFHDVYKTFSGSLNSVSLLIGGISEKNEAMDQMLAQAKVELAKEREQNLHAYSEYIDKFGEVISCIEPVKGVCDRLLSEFNGVSSDIGDYHKKNELIQKDIHSAIVNESKESRVELQSFLHIVEQKDAAIARLVARNNELEKEAEESQTEILKIAREIERGEDEKKRVEKGYLKAKNFIMSKEEEIRGLQAELSELLQEKEGLQTNLNATKKVVHALNAQKNVLLKKVEEVEKLNTKFLEQIQNLKGDSQVFQDKVFRMQSSFSWQVTSPLRYLRRNLMDKTIQTPRPPVEANHTPPGKSDVKQADPYQHWIQNVEPKMLGDYSSFSRTPKISVIMPIYKPDPQFLKEAIESVFRQNYTNWELCLADDHSEDKDVEKLIYSYAREDSRIKFTLLEKNSHISTCTNAALELATGEFVAFMDHDDLLREFSLSEMVLALNDTPSAKLIYSDEDKVDERGRRHSPHFKPDWNPQLILSQNYICHFLMIKASLVKEVGGLRVGVEGSQDWDLVLRTTEKLSNDEIVHIPKVLYHWRESPQSTSSKPGCKPYVVNSSLRTLEDYYNRKGIRASVEQHTSGYFIPSIQMEQDPTLTIIIPTRNGGEVLQRCIDSLYRYSSEGMHYEVLVIDNGSDDLATINLLNEYQDKKDNFNVLRDPSPFNYSSLNNKAVDSVSTELVLLLNDDTEMISPDWLDRIKSHAMQPEVGAVGIKLLYPDKSIQHAGIILGIGGVAGHGFRKMPRNTNKQFNRANLPHNVSAVTGACLCVKRSIYKEVGGLDESRLKVAFNDVDFCLKVRESGYLNLYLGNVEAYHFESLSRGFEDTPEKLKRFQTEVKVMKERWGSILESDPFYSSNFSLLSEQFDIRSA